MEEPKESENKRPEKEKDTGQEKEAYAKVIPRVIEDELKASYLDYSMSVIVGRALPDVRDGLKPVHRRILFAMHKMGMFHNKPFKKCARIVGEVLGKFHPHGDSAVYDSLVRMAQSWSLRYPLINGQGNFGSIDGDSAAAMRYTEAKLRKISEEMLQDIDKNTVDFNDNFDGSLKEPSYLPSKLPNLLVNGSSGIAVGMATNMLPHNLNEVADATVHVIENPECRVEELMQHMKGPDFPTAGIILGKKGIRDAYSTGRGKVAVKARAEIEEKDDKKRIIITEIPYMINKSNLLEETANLVRDKKIDGISDLRDESSREGMRIVILLKRNFNPEVVLNQLYKHTRLKTSFGIINLALVDNQPKVLNLKEIIQHYISHRQEIVRKRTEFDLKKAEDRAHILEGLLVALKDIDATVKMIKESDNADKAKEVLISSLSITEKQAISILEMRLQRLTGLEQEKIKNEHKGLIETIEDLRKILADENEILKIIKNELYQLKSDHGNDRKTEIIEGEDEEMLPEDLIVEENVAVSVTHSGYIKRQALDSYRAQKRGGRGIRAAATKEEDFVEDLFIANTHSHLLFFTNKGKLKWMKVYEVPEAGRTAKGSAIVNLLKLDEDEKVNAYIQVKSLEEGFLFMATKKGVVKKTPLSEFSRPRQGGIRAISLDEKDELISVKLTSGEKNMIIGTKEGLAIKFSEKDVRSMGRTARGVRGINLRQGDEAVGMVVADEDSTLFTITENGYGKRTKISDYRQISRGGKGVTNIICSERNGKVIGIKSVTDDSDLMIMSRKGIGIRMAAKDISVIGRATQGVRVIRLEEDDMVAAVARIAKE